MAQSSKAAARRGKPSYIMSIIGVTLVLFLLGVVGWLVINGNKLGDYFRENIEVKAYIKGEIVAQDSIALTQAIAIKPYVRTWEFVNREEARNRFIFQEKEDPSGVLGYNPLPHAIHFLIKKEYANVDSLEKIKADLQLMPLFATIDYPQGTVANLNETFRKITMYLLVFAIIMAISVIFLIDNTIRLAMFSNRFLIKTMQMVGATRWFIAKPLSIRAVINGAISALIAIVLVYLLMTAAQKNWPDLAALNDTKMIVMLFIALLIIGITITLLSTYRSVLKYLRMKLDELY